MVLYKIYYCAFLRESVCERQQEGAVRALHVFLRAIEVDQEELDEVHADMQADIDSFKAFMRENQNVDSQALRKLNLREKEKGSKIIWKDKSETLAHDAKTGEEIEGLGGAIEQHFMEAALAKWNQRALSFNPNSSEIPPHIDMVGRSRLAGSGPDDLILPS